MPQPANDYDACYEYLRMAYYLPTSGTWNATALKELAATAYQAGTKETVVVATSSEGGGSGTAQVKFNKLVLLQAIMGLLRAECADSLPPDDATGSITNFGSRPLSL